MSTVRHVPTDLAEVEGFLATLEERKKDAERNLREQTQYLRDAERRRDNVNRDIAAWQQIAKTLKEIGS